MDAATDPARSRSRSRRRRRPASPPPGTAEESGAGLEYDLAEPTMAEKLAAMSLPAAADGETAGAEEDGQATAAGVVVPPSADSVHVLLKQALRADDRAALLGCLYNRDNKVIAKSISLLTPADAVKFLKSLISLMQSRGSVLVCLLPWLQTLLGRHMSSIVSQESSLQLLNSLYQMIDARTSTFALSLKMSTCLDYHFSEIGDDESDGEDEAPMIIYEDKDSDEEESEVDDDAMETEDKETEEEESEVDDM